MPAVSKKQRQAAGMATAIQEGKMKPQPGMPATEMAGSMKPADLREFATTPEKGLPPRQAPKPAPAMRSKATPTGAIKKMPFK